MKFMTYAHNVFGDVHGAEGEDGIVWFAAEDICKALDIKYGRNAMMSIAPEDKQNAVMGEGKNRRKKSIITEAGMYELVFKSRKKEAREFTRWVTHEVLPSIRRNGGYIFGQENLPAADRKNLEEKIRELAAEVEKAKAGNEKLSKYLAEEEDRNFALNEELRDTRKELNTVRKDFSKIEHAKRYVDALTGMREFDARKPEFLAMDKEREAAEARIPYAKAEPVEADPLVRDKYGNVCRRSEVLERNRNS